MNTTTRTTARKSYLVRCSFGSWEPCIDTVLLDRGGLRKESYYPTPASYQRFVRLANSGDYTVSFPNDEEGVCWELRRKAA